MLIQEKTGTVSACAERIRAHERAGQEVAQHGADLEALYEGHDGDGAHEEQRHVVESERRVRFDHDEMCAGGESEEC